MARQIPERILQAIEAIVAAHAGGIGIQGIGEALAEKTARRTLQYRVKYLVDQGRLVKEGKNRWARYRSPPEVEERERGSSDAYEESIAAQVPISRVAENIQNQVRKPLNARTPVGCDRSFLDGYRPNTSAYLSEKERARLHKAGSAPALALAGGTYARHFLNRLLIDLSWNSSRLEGNTYSLLDTRRLIEFGEEAHHGTSLEAQMILNHKDAIEFLVDSANEVGFNRPTILNLHALLANNLLSDPEAPGRLGHIAVGIERSVFHPLEVPQLIEECFEQSLVTASAVRDPFEQALFVMAQLPYLQPFDDVNKRVARLAANISFIHENLIPISFVDVPTRLYTDAMLGVYESKRIELLKDLFIWAYERSASRYTAVRQSLGEPDPFRFKYRAAMRELLHSVVVERLGRNAAFMRIADWTARNVEVAQQNRFREVVENELLGLHEGNVARYRIRAVEFDAWQKSWNRPEM